MVHILAEVCVEDVDRFLALFGGSGKALRVRHGCLRSTVFRSQNPQVLTVLFEWNSREGFEAFTRDPLARESMQASGTIAKPQFTFLEKAAEYPG